MCASMVDIQSATAEIRRGKEEEDRKKPQCENIMACPIAYGGHNNCNWIGLTIERKLFEDDWIVTKTRMWANAQRDGRPAEYRWRPVLNTESLARAHCSTAVQ